jgi:ATP-dependent RNA circularization protein (DNA/RNA ligase family)
MIHSYSKVFALGHPQIENLCMDQVLVQEKLDGSQFSFMREVKYNGIDTDDTLHMRSKGALIFPAAPPALFKKAVDAVLEVSDKLTPGFVYRAECLTSRTHNTLTYERAPKNWFVVFDIEDMNAGAYHFLPTGKIMEECGRLGFEYVGCDRVATIASTADLAYQMALPSMLGGAREGVVLKNYARYTEDGKVMMGKYVSEKFKEVHQGAWKANNPTGTDIIEQLILRLATEARYEKAVQHLREGGRLLGDLRDIGPLIREVQTDVIAEETERIAKALLGWAKGKIERGVGRGVPQWYKDRLVKQQFGEVIDVNG